MICISTPSAYYVPTRSFSRCQLCCTCYGVLRCFTCLGLLYNIANYSTQFLLSTAIFADRGLPHILTCKFLLPLGASWVPFGYLSSYTYKFLVIPCYVTTWAFIMQHHLDIHDSTLLTQGYLPRIEQVGTP